MHLPKALALVAFIVSGTMAGHGAGKPVSKIIDEVTDRWTFLSKTLDFQWH